MKTSRKRILALIILLVITAVVEGCVLYDQSNLQTDQQSGQLAGTTIRNITIEAFAFGYNPESITLKQGETVRLEIVNIDIIHTFTIDELGINIPLPAGQTITMEITPNKSGTFMLYCAVPGHKEAGMAGEVLVE